MNTALFVLGIYILLGALFIGLRWKKIAVIGRMIVGDKVRIAIPFFVLLWPPFAYTFLKDEILVWSCVRRARRNSPVCPCGRKIGITASHIRALRDDEPASFLCPCGVETPMGPEKSASKNP
jgi:hypothetical protein